MILLGGIRKDPLAFPKKEKKGNALSRRKRSRRSSINEKKEEIDLLCRAPTPEKKEEDVAAAKGRGGKGPRRSPLPQNLGRGKKGRNELEGGKKGEKKKKRRPTPTGGGVKKEGERTTRKKNPTALRKIRKNLPD